MGGRASQVESSLEVEWPREGENLSLVSNEGETSNKYRTC